MRQVRSAFLRTMNEKDRVGLCGLLLTTGAVLVAPPAAGKCESGGDTSLNHAKVVQDIVHVKILARYERGGAPIEGWPQYRPRDRPVLARAEVKNVLKGDVPYDFLFIWSAGGCGPNVDGLRTGKEYILFLEAPSNRRPHAPNDRYLFPCSDLISVQDGRATGRLFCPVRDTTLTVEAIKRSVRARDIR